ncbi:MAG: DUF559 domain-containing protein [Austwickia sp.]|nr:DUF559 domain-containing protein [Actinomycetota bacterium]MCO5310238.1 DUF559 domain-containing protein [Austwickia sp.]
MVLFMRATDPELAVYHQGLYESALDAGDLLTRCQAVLLIAPAGSYISHATAGRLQGLWVPNTAAIDVSVLPGRCRVMDSHFAVHRGRVDARVRTLAGLRVSDPIQVAADLGYSPQLTVLTPLLDSVLRRTETSKDWLGAELNRRLPRLRRLQQALAFADARSESAPESLLRVLLLVGGFPAPVCQYKVVDSKNDRSYRVDLAYPALKIAVEYNGRHHRDKVQRALDKARRKALRRLGWKVVVIEASELFNDPGGVLARIAVAVNERSGQAPTIDPAWRDHFTEHASRLWADQQPKKAGAQRS